MTPREAAEKLIRDAIMKMTQEQGIAPADAGRALLVELARWFGIDFEREAARIVED